MSENVLAVIVGVVVAFVNYRIAKSHNIVWAVVGFLAGVYGLAACWLWFYVLPWAKRAPGRSQIPPRPDL